MFGSFPSIVAAIALAIAVPLAHAQSGPGGVCGGLLTPDQGAFFKFKQTQNFTVLTMTNNDGSFSRNESYVLYCDQQQPGLPAVLNTGIVGDSVEFFRVPLTNVMVDDTFTSTYIELVNQSIAISILSQPQNIISPCLQKRVAEKNITTMLDDGTQYTQIDAAFRTIQNPAQPKDIWMPHSVDIEPLYRADYIRAVSLFFNQGQVGQDIFGQIKAAYENHRSNMAGVPQDYKRRIGWIKYDFGAQHWTLRNSKFTTSIIRDAGGIPFPLSGDSLQDNLPLTTDEVKLVILNSNVLIDQTEYPPNQNGMTLIRQKGGFDYNYRVAGRPDLLLKDMIRAQYPSYLKSVGNFTFFNVKWGNSGTDGVVFNATLCGVPDPFRFNDAPYNNDNIMAVPTGNFTDYYPAPAPPTGGGMYGSYDRTSSGNGKKSSVGIVVGVIVAAVVMAAGFAFAFFKWGKRAKEDRFIELEEEMNNEIPMH
ncbi:hypothetical protein BG000_003742 [Podila horticola]|nr:hypothetical protein BG000_003742 [Podila horticola]